MNNATWVLACRAMCVPPPRCRFSNPRLFKSRIARAIVDRDAENGMTTSVGRIRADEVMPNGIKYLLVSHNAAMGAGRGAVLLAEYLQRTGYLS